MKRFFQILALLVIWGTASSAAEQAFWKDCSGDFQSVSGHVYQAAEERLKSQGYLVHTLLEAPFQDLEPRDVLASLHKDVEKLKVLGQKKVQFQEAPAILLSFRGSVGEKELHGRALLFPDGERAALLMLVRHSEAQGELLEAFQRLEREGLETLSSETDS